MSTRPEGTGTGLAPTGWRCRASRLAAGLTWVALASGCGSGPALPPPPAPVSPVVVPPGVDSTVAAIADSVADESFVSIATEEEAEALRSEGQRAVERSDSVWLSMSALLDSGRVVTPEDSIAAREATIAGGSALVELDDLLRSPNPDAEALLLRTEALLDSAQVALERSFQLDPFDARSRSWLARVYELQARRLGREQAYERAVTELEKLTLLVPDDHTVHAMLANDYFRLGDWVRAASSYGKAGEVYLATYDLVVEDPGPPDSTLVFSYARAEGDMHVRRLDADRAIAAYRRAERFATTDEDYAYIAGELEWIDWDGGRIASSLARDSLLALEQEGSLAEARSGYEDLLARVTTTRAVDEVDWRLAIVDYNLGAADEAAARLQGLVERMATDSLGAPVDSEAVRYFDDYGRLCLSLGRQARAEQRDRRTALKYFTQAAEVSWSGRAVAHLEIAGLVRSNVPVALEHARSALRLEGALTEPQRADLYRLLMELHRRVGDFDAARAFRDAFRELRGGEVER